MTEKLPLAEIARAHRALEPSHAFIYFAPQAEQRYAALGLSGGYEFYFASRAAPLGAASAQLVTATFYNFAPGVIARCIPAVWQVAGPEQVLAARWAAVDDVLGPATAEVLGEQATAEAAELAGEAAGALTAAGRPLYAAHAGLAVPDPAHLRLWHALTLLREWRGDGHVALLVAADIGGAEALHLDAACGGPALRVLQATRGWREPEWSSARDQLVERGLLDGDGATPAGVDLRAALERDTNELDRRAWEQLGAERTQRLVELVRPLSARLAPMVAAMAATKG